MSTHAPSPTAQRIWLGLAFLLLAVFLYYVRDTLPPFLIAFAAAALLDPLLDRMQRRGWSRMWAAAIVFIIFLLVFVGVALVLIPAAVQQASEFIRNAPRYYEEVSARLNALVKEQDLLRRLGPLSP
jgi:predicted PurR-regulated permease PerM